MQSKSHTDPEDEMTADGLKRNFFQRLFGLCATPRAKNESCWTYADGKIEVDLERARELSGKGGVLRLEQKGLFERVLVIRDAENKYVAIRNRCSHASRRLDPIPGTKQVQCCSISKSTYDWEGCPKSGPGKKPLVTYPVTVEQNRLIIRLAEKGGTAT
jgi:nitrite reductase/ring-hydroxylating ferredoxin subunit